MFGSMAKWVVEIDRAERIPELVSRAFHVATQGRPGPVVVALPEDMLTDEVEVADALPYAPVIMKPGAADMEALQRDAGQPGAPGLSALEAAGDLWLRVYRYEDAVAAYERAATYLGMTPSITASLARARSGLGLGP